MKGLFAVASNQMNVTTIINGISKGRILDSGQQHVTSRFKKKGRTICCYGFSVFILV